MSQFDKNIILKPNLITFIIYIVLVRLYTLNMIYIELLKGIIKIGDSIRDTK